MHVCRRFGETLLRMGISKEEFNDVNFPWNNFRSRINKITNLNCIKEFMERHEEAKRFPDQKRCES